MDMNQNPLERKKSSSKVRIHDNLEKEFDYK